MTGWIILGVIVLVALWAVAIFNKLVKNRNLVLEGWSGIDVQLKRRYDLIPNLVETVKRYAGHEKEVLAKIVELRNSAAQAQTASEKAPIENMLTQTLRQLFALAEAYPDLKANQNFLDLQRKNSLNRFQLFMKITVIMLMLVLLPVLTLANEMPGVQIIQKDLDFPACPDSPNCVSSLARDQAQKTGPFPILGSPAQSMERIAVTIESMPRGSVVSRSEGMLQAEFRSIMGFVDEVLFKVSSDGKMIHVRSAARTGYWDLGVNRRRVEKIRSLYLESGI